MKKICLLIGEGDSERYFFPKILEKKSFQALSAKEGSSSIYHNNDLYWFFPYPPNLGNNKSGKERLKKPATYRLAMSYVKNNSHIFGETYEIYLLVVFDTDTASQNDRKKEIETAISSSGTPFKVSLVFPVEIEIESWYFAGLETKFPYFLSSNDHELKELLHTKTTVRHSKENFNKFINNDKMIDAKDISQAVAEFFNDEKAIQYSDSFKNCNEVIKKYGLY